MFDFRVVEVLLHLSLLIFFLGLYFTSVWGQMSTEEPPFVHKDNAQARNFFGVPILACSRFSFAFKRWEKCHSSSKKFGPEFLVYDLV